MKLPKGDTSSVQERKITCYLLNPAHPAGGSEASSFLCSGYTVVDCEGWPRPCFGTHLTLT